MKTLVLVLMVFCLMPWQTFAQKDIPLLERTITISFGNERLEVALKRIAEQGGFTFSYNSTIIEANKLITQNFKRKTVREILDIIFAGAIEYKIRSNHIILTKAKDTSKKEQEKVFSGYVIDEATGERLKNVSIYDPITLNSTVTDSYGYFELKIDEAAEAVNLSVNKQNYSDTVVSVPVSSRRLLNIPIRIDKKKWVTVADSVSQKFKRLWERKFLRPKSPTVRNIRDTLYKPFQFSLFPFAGTNHLISGNVVNDFSFNLVGGYSQGIKFMEIGGVFNIDREDVNGFQLAGVFNTVGGNFTGVQVAGVFNSNFESTEGAQIAGVANINWNTSHDFSLAGVMNFTLSDSHGFHVAGVNNFTVGKQKGTHIAGIYNFSTDDSGPMQGAGVFNFAARNFEGGQLAGVFNFTGKNFIGGQTAGVLNFTGGEVRGSQVAGVLNYATKVRGTQLALFNFADSVKGVPIGLFSFVLHGYHKIEISADEIFYANASFRTGVNKFYNIFTVGAKPESFSEDQTYWTFGYGFGTAPRLTKWLALNIDVTANQVVTDQKFEAINLLNKLYTGFDVQFARHFSLAFGATLNAYVTESNYEGYKPLFTDYNPKIIREENYASDINMKMWWGAKVGLRFL